MKKDARKEVEKSETMKEEVDNHQRKRHNKQVDVNIDNKKGISLIILSVLIAIIAMVIARKYTNRRRYVPKNSEPSDSKASATESFVRTQSMGWALDTALADGQADIKCDFPIYTLEELDNEEERIVDEQGNIVTYNQILASPAILKNFMNNWSSFQNQNSTGSGNSNSNNDSNDNGSGNVWSRKNIMKKYGKKVVVYDSPSNLAHSSDRPNVMKFQSLQRVLSDIRTARSLGVKISKGDSEYDSVSDKVIYDVTMTSHMKNDFSIPKIFQNWDKKNVKDQSAGSSGASGASGARGIPPGLQEQRKRKYEEEKTLTVLSIGSTKTGLSFHSHGRSYFGLIYGLKRWFVYPLGTNPPKNIIKETHPLRSVWAWFTGVYPIYDDMAQNENIVIKKPSLLNNHNEGNHNKNGNKNKNKDQDEGYRPLECVQKPGEIFYLPAGWLHSTMNIGETIGIGQQNVLKSQERYDIHNNILNKINKNDFNSRKNIAISKAYFGMDEENRIKYNITASTSEGMVRLNPHIKSPDIVNLVISGEDTWYVQYFNQNSDHSRAKALLWNRVSNSLKNFVSVGSIEVPSKKFRPDEHADVVKRHNLDSYIDKETGEFTQQVVRVFLGGDRSSSGSDTTTIEKLIQNSIELDPKEHLQAESGLGIGITIMPQTFVNYIIDLIAEKKLPTGSVTTVSAKSKRLYKEAITILEKCLLEQPYHADIRTMLADIFGYANLDNEMKESINDSVNTYNNLASIALASNWNQYEATKLNPNNKNNMKNFIPSTTLAPIFHQLSELYITRENGKDALVLLEKSLALQPDYGPALLDKILVYIFLKDKKNIEIAMDNAMIHGNILKSHPKLSQIREYWEAMEHVDEERKNGKLNMKEPRNPNLMPRRGAPPIPPKSMKQSIKSNSNEQNTNVDIKGKRTSLEEDLNDLTKGFGHDHKNHDGENVHAQNRGMSKEEALLKAKDRFANMNEEEYNVFLKKQQAATER
jgi:tetratricopeptide (TPR) repeat protein